MIAKESRNTYRRGQAPGAKKGFTLTELVIVLAILAILAAIVILSVTGYIQRSRVAACETEQRSLQTAVYAYRFESGYWPVEDDEDAGSQTVAEGGADIKWDATYTRTIAGEEKTFVFIPNYIDDEPASDAACDWWLDEDGRVYPKKAANCPCH